MKQYHHLIPHTKWIKDLNIRPETIKLEENTGGKLLDIGLGNDFFFKFDTKCKAIKEKINKWDYRKSKCFCTAKETINRMKGQHTEWEEIFANHIFKELLTQNIK